jgi:hypothetical protein
MCCSTNWVVGMREEALETLDVASSGGIKLDDMNFHKLAVRINCLHKMQTTNFVEWRRTWTSWQHKLDCPANSICQDGPPTTNLCGARSTWTRSNSTNLFLICYTNFDRWTNALCGWTNITYRARRIILVAHNCVEGPVRLCWSLTVIRKVDWNSLSSLLYAHLNDASTPSTPDCWQTNYIELQTYNFVIKH